MLIFQSMAEQIEFNPQVAEIETFDSKASVKVSVISGETICSNLEAESSAVQLEVFSSSCIFCHKYVFKMHLFSNSRKQKVQNLSHPILQETIKI